MDGHGNGGGNTVKFGTRMIFMGRRSMDGLRDMDMGCIPTTFWHSDLANMRTWSVFLEHS